MKFNYENNPNTLQFWDEYYRQRLVERKNPWLFPKAIEILDTLGDCPRALEVGCGAGRTIVELRKIKKDVRWSGVDISKIAIERARQTKPWASWHYLDVVEESAHVLSALWEVSLFAPGTFQFILCAETLEHLSAPGPVCTLFSIWLAKDGKMLITVPVEGSPLDKNSVNLHHVTFSEKDFAETLFPENKVETFRFDNQHLGVIVYG